MTLLERIFGVETMARIREEARQTQARALERSRERITAAVPAADAARMPLRQAPAGVSARVAGVRSASAGGFVDVLPADFPTSILGAPAVAAPPLLTAFASREALLAAIVYSEALAPPVALR